MINKDCRTLKRTACYSVTYARYYIFGNKGAMDAFWLLLTILGDLRVDWKHTCGYLWYSAWLISRSEDKL